MKKTHTPDRVPAMCQLSIGHYLLNTDIPPAELWHSTEAYTEALVTLQEKYEFDGILVNLPGRPKDWKKNIERIEDAKDHQTVIWSDGSKTVCPSDDNAINYRIHPQTGEFVRDTSLRPSIDDIEPNRFFYENPHTRGGLKYPYFYYDIEDHNNSPDDPDSWFPDYEFRAYPLLREKTDGVVSIHGEVFSPFTQFMELLGYEEALIALITHPDKSRAILNRYAKGSTAYAVKLVEQEVDAILMSSAFAGAGFISRDMYGDFVLPYENMVWEAVKNRKNDMPCYTHTCGAIGDRLDLMIDTGLDGIDTLDPPPLGTVELDEAKKEFGDKVFFKGNIDSVNTLLHGSDREVRNDVIQRIKWGMPGGGYILSTACSVAPRVHPNRLKLLSKLAKEYGQY